MDKEANDLRREALRNSWAMRGGLTYEQALSLSFDERKFVSELVKENIDITKKTKLPYF